MTPAGGFLAALVLVAVSGVHAAPALPIPAPEALLPKLPLSRTFRGLNGTAKYLVAADRARAKHFIEAARKFRAAGVHATPEHRAASSFSVLNTAVIYTASVGIGTPPTQYDLLLDTGSANTWVGADQPYVPTSSSASTNQTVSVQYGSGAFCGSEYTDTVTLSPSLVITNQSIGVATASQGFQGSDGILGIGNNRSSSGTVSGMDVVSTVTDSLYAQGTISSAVLGFSMQPTNTTSQANGELTFGGVDPSRYTGSIAYVPITKTFPSSYYFGVNASFGYGAEPMGLYNNAGIVDTGTTLIMLATDTYNRYVAATGAVYDDDTGLLRVTPANYKARMLNMFFKPTGSKTQFSLTKNAQTWPRALNSAIGGTDDYVYLVVADLGTNQGSGLDWILGYTALERLYTVFDSTNSRLGFATTPYTNATVN